MLRLRVFDPPRLAPYLGEGVSVVIGMLIKWRF